MIRSTCSFPFVFLFIAALPLAAQAQDSKTLTAEGVADIHGNARDIARNAAVEDARKRAVEQEIGILIGSQTEVENYQLISDKILSRSREYIKRYTVAEETEDSGLLRVRITADVFLPKLIDDLSAIGIQAQMRRDAGGARTRPINIAISGLNRTELAKFKDVLKNQVRGIKDLHELSFAGTTARLSVHSTVSARTLSDELAMKDFGTFSVEVVGSTAASLQLKVTLK